MIEIQHVLILDLHDTCDVLNTYDLLDIVLGYGVKSLSFEINAQYLELCDHEEFSSMWFIVYEEIGNYEFYRHEQHMFLWNLHGT